MVLGWKYLHSMQRFWRLLSGFGKIVKFDKSRPKPLHGMGIGWLFVIFGNFDQNSLRVLLGFVNFSQPRSEFWSVRRKMSQNSLRV